MAELDWSLYWFMLPVATMVTTTAMLSGTGGATYFTPIFLVVLPLLGPQYPLQSMAASIGAALLTMVFGFSSGFIGYWRRHLIDYRSALPFIAIAVPVACAGALMLAALKSYDGALIGVYACLMLVVAGILGRRGAPSPQQSGGVAQAPATASRSLTTSGGETFRYKQPRLGPFGAAVTAVGAFLTGLLGVGIGESLMPQLVKRNSVPLPVAAGISVFTVILTIICASAVQVASLGAAEIPWNLVCYTIPGVIIGGQIGPRLQGRVPQRVMERVIATLFSGIAAAMAWIALRKLGLI